MVYVAKESIAKKICVKLVCWTSNVEEHQNLKINIQQLPVIYLTEKYLLENRLFVYLNK